MYTYRHRVQFYETDMMGIVHHSNYIRFYEEARVGWAHSRDILDYQKPESASHMAVLETWVRHLRPCKFGDELDIQVQAKLEGVRLTFEYKMFCVNDGAQIDAETGKRAELVSVARTVHAPLNKDLQVIRMPIHIREVFKKNAEKNLWIETWLSNL